MKNKKGGLIRFKTIKVKGNVLTGGKVFYRGVVMAEETRKIRAIAAEMVDRGCCVEETTIAYVLDFLADAMPDMIARDGCRRELGNLVTFYPVIGGTFPGMDSKYDAARNTVRIAAAVTRHDLRAALEGVEIRNVTGTPAARLAYWQPRRRSRT